MKLSPHVFDATAENFDRLVLENSYRGPVLVHFWTPRAGPCMILMPRLVRLATEYGGKFLLVMLNTDELGPVARQHCVNSVPTVKVFLRGAVVQTVHGAESDSHFRGILDRLVIKNVQSLYAQGLVARQQGHMERAKKLLAAAAVEEPESADIPRELAKTLWANGEGRQALELLDSLPGMLRDNAGLSLLRAHFSLAIAANIEDEDVSQQTDSDKKFRLAAQRLANDEMETALELLLKLHEDDPGYRNGLPRQSLLALFDLLGKDHEFVREYRTLLARNSGS
ncbi:MAG: tetratricopeptide repeat protein [Hydrogenophilaceae bacterium]|nr:tetratricopeptide repeat protein [Hydrogenophilaceae bacterium]